MKRYTILLFPLLILTACGDEPINRIITHEITTEPDSTAPALVRSVQSTNRVWLITEAYEQRAELHGQIISVVGYVGGQSNHTGTWYIDFWNEPLPTYESMYRNNQRKEPDKLEKWDDKGTGVEYWCYGQDFASIGYAHVERLRPEGVAKDP